LERDGLVQFGIVFGEINSFLLQGDIDLGEELKNLVFLEPVAPVLDEGKDFSFDLAEDMTKDKLTALWRLS
jgi:hypothetical protein